jgi:hypothetical protein
LEGSEDSGGTRDERGTLIHFPRSGWIPADGIQPLNGSPRTVDPPDAQDEASERPERRAAFEAGDFWDSGETQEFVGVASAAGDSTQAEPQASAAGRTQTSGELRQQLLRTPLIGAAVAVTVMAGGGVAAWRLISARPDRFKSSAVSLRADDTASATHRVTTHSAPTVQHRLNAQGKQRHARSSTHGKSRANRRASASSLAPT